MVFYAPDGQLAPDAVYNANGGWYPTPPPLPPPQVPLGVFLAFTLGLPVATLLLSAIVARSRKPAPEPSGAS